MGFSSRWERSLEELDRIDVDRILVRVDIDAMVGRVDVDPGDREQVRAFMERATELVTRAYGSAHPASAARWRQLAEVYAADGDTGRAAGLLDAGLTVSRRTTGDASILTADLLFARARVDLLDAEKRETSLNQLRNLWKDETGSLPGVVSLQFKEPVLGPAGQAISITKGGMRSTSLAPICR